MEGGVVVTILLNIAGIPVDRSTSPFNRSLSVARKTTGPDGELDTCRGLREVPLLSGRVVGV